MKHTRRFASIAAAALLASCAVVPVMSALPASAASIEITGISTTQAHTFEVYQVFTGTLSGNKLSNIKWGSGVTSYDGTNVTEGAAVDEAIITALTAADDARSFIDDFVLSSTKACADVTSTNGTASITDLADGYYIVKDVTDLGGADDANSAWIVQVAGTVQNLAIKNAKPTVDKQVLDETADAEAGATGGWGESADHAINEKFQFKLTATIPADEDLKVYDSYKLVFNDTMSAGVTFESIESVSVGGTNINASDYEETATSETNKDGLTWTLTIDDVKKVLPSGVTLGEDEITVEVVYNAHLNANAIISKDSDTDIATNNNKVNLEYSNNPDSTGTGTTDGKTTDDYVWVFTYEVDNTKYKDSAAVGNELAGAEFKLYDSDGSTEIGLIYDTNKGAYRPIASSETASAMTSAETTGKFNIIGLDAGTYVLKETKTPDGYNTCADTEIVISATHVENGAGTAANLTFENTTKNMVNSIVNKSGSTLPSTGGIGTTIFYVAGGVLVVGAGVLLITKKRAKNMEA